jgi:L,D-peptidoglycan transpeptidase YkuD (ErfK/YbiS/YcfS/YnhG family)
MAPIDLIVTPHAGGKHTGTLTVAGRSFKCVIGRAGARANKKEGDGATPVGRFALRRVLYRADRGGKPETSLPVAVIAADDGWCDAPMDPAYNRPVKLPYRSSAEKMTRDDRLYDLVVVLGHNDAPVKPGAGSAIFLHVAPENGGPTAGCVGLSPNDLREVLKLVDAKSTLVVKG